MNVQCSLIWELILYEFELDHNAVEAAKNICCAKSEGTDNVNTVTTCFEEFCLGYKNFDSQVR